MSPTSLEWSYNPWRDRPGRAAVALVGALACCVAATSLRLPAIPTVVLCVVCVTALAVGFVPVRCRLDEDGVTRRSGWFAEHRRWRGLQRAVRSAEGVLLSPYRRRHWLDPYRALFLPLPHAAPPLAADLDRVLSSHGL